MENSGIHNKDNNSSEKLLAEEYLDLINKENLYSDKFNELQNEIENVKIQIEQVKNRKESVKNQLLNMR